MSLLQTRYKQFNQLLQASGASLIDVSALQGYLIGFASATNDFITENWINVSKQSLDINTTEPIDKIIDVICLSAQQELQQEPQEDQPAILSILLPEDSSDIQERMQALTSWCESFLNGFIIHNKHKITDAMAIDAISNLQKIASVRSWEYDDSESAEQDYADVLHYVSLAPAYLAKQHKTSN